MQTESAKKIEIDLETKTRTRGGTERGTVGVNLRKQRSAGTYI